MMPESLQRVATIAADESRFPSHERARRRTQVSTNRARQLRPASRVSCEAPAPDQLDVSSSDTQRWIREAQRGSVAAFESLYRAHVGGIYALCMRMTGHRGDAEDCAQNAFISAWRRLDQFQGASRFSTWLHRIAVNEVLMLRRRRREVETDSPDDWAIDASAPEIGVDLEAALQALPTQARHVFVLRAIYGHSHDEIAELLELAPGTVRAHYFRARELLKRALGLEDDDESERNIAR